MHTHAIIAALIHLLADLLPVAARDQHHPFGLSLSKPFPSYIERKEILRQWTPIALSGEQRIPVIGTNGLG